MHLTGRYAVGIYFGIGGLAAIALIASVSVPDDVKLALHQSQIERSAALERAKLKQQTETEREQARLARQRADTYANSEVLDAATFSIWGYTDNPKIPPKLDYRAFNPTGAYKIFDGTGKCIGWVIDREFYWRHSKSNNDICNREF